MEMMFSCGAGAGTISAVVIFNRVRGGVPASNGRHEGDFCPILMASFTINQRNKTVQKMVLRFSAPLYFNFSLLTLVRNVESSWFCRRFSPLFRANCFVLCITPVGCVQWSVLTLEVSVTG